ncbi:MAG: hypothetical protein ACKVLN_04635 [Rhodobacterales bacterium]
MAAQVGGYLNHTFPDYNIAMRRRIDGGFDLRPRNRWRNGSISGCLVTRA